MEGLKGKDYGKVRQRYPDYVLTESGEDTFSLSAASANVAVAHRGSAAHGHGSNPCLSHLAGLQYKDLRDGSGEAAQQGSKVTIDWDGYTIGYYGRPFEGRNKV